MNAAPCPILAIDVPPADRIAECRSAPPCRRRSPRRSPFPKPGLLIIPERNSLPGSRRRHRNLRGGFAGGRSTPKTADRATVATALPPRPRDTHKGSYGHVLVLAGSVGKNGAAMLCGARRAACRRRARDPRLARAHGRDARDARADERAAPRPETGPSRSRTRSLRAFFSFSTARTRWFSVQAWARRRRFRTLTEWLVASSPLPLVIDADGLELSRRADRLATQEAFADRSHAASGRDGAPRLRGAGLRAKRSSQRGAEPGDRLRRDGGAQGARTVIASPDGIVSINPTGNPAWRAAEWATRLPHDRLGGSLRASVKRACEAAVFCDGYGADRVARRRGEAGLLASDVIEELPPALAELQAELYTSAAPLRGESREARVRGATVASPPHPDSLPKAEREVFTVESESADETLRLGQNLGCLLRSGDVIGIDGDLAPGDASRLRGLAEASILIPMSFIVLRSP